MNAKQAEFDRAADVIADRIIRRHPGAFKSRSNAFHVAIDVLVERQTTNAYPSGRTDARKRQGVAEGTIRV